MSVPKSVTTVTREGVEFTSSVDRVNYTMKELCRAALRDVGKFICKRFRQAYYSHFRRGAGRVGKYTQYWVKWKREDVPSLQVGIKKNAFYGAFQELGDSRNEKLGLLTKSTEDNINTIIQIESQYLSAMEDEAKALSMISEEDYEGGAE